MSDDPYRSAEGPITKMQWARWKRMSVVSISLGLGLALAGFGAVLAMRGCNRTAMEAAAREAQKPCADELHTGDGIITCRHHDHVLDVVTYKGSGAALCRCRGAAAPAVSSAKAVDSAR